MKRISVISTLIVFSLTGGCGLQTLTISNHPSKRLLKEYQQGKRLPDPVFALHHPGSPEPVNLSDYGDYFYVGTNDYRYKTRDLAGLRDAMPEGIYPNHRAVSKNPRFKIMKSEGLLDGDHWEMLGSDDLEAAYFVWATAPAEPGVKAFFSGIVLERAGHLVPALHAYQTVITHYARSAAYSRDGSFVWYVSQAALGNIRRIVRDYPDLGWIYTGGEISVENGGDTNLSDDVFKITPGHFVQRTLKERLAGAPSLDRLRITAKRGDGKVQVVQFENGHWQLMINGEPAIVRGVTYAPTKIGLGPKSDPRYFDLRWMHEDVNQNGLVDAPHESWIDQNGNGAQDSNEQAVGDFALLNRAGVNAIRMYLSPNETDRYDPKMLNKPLLREMYERRGISVIVGNFFGAYTLGSGASWEEGTDYTDPQQRGTMKAYVRDMVMDLKDEPFILFWILGNENNMRGDFTGVNATRTNASSEPRAYASFLNEVAEMIHEIDPDHPVAVGNLGTGLLEVYKEFAPAIDIVGINSYRGEHGFGTLWQEAQNLYDRPVLITEFGCDAFHEGRGINEEGQARYIEGGVRDIELNQAGGLETGNAIGGIVFSFLDEWWKDTHSGDPEDLHQTKPQGFHAFPDGLSHEEWFGIAGQGSGKNSPFERRLRRAFHYLESVWGS